MTTPLEQIPEGEASDIEAVVATSLALLDTGRRPVRRGQHAKTNAALTGTLTVHPVPAEAGIGLFAEPRTYEAMVRFSNGAQQDDREKDVHGMAVKLLDVAGPRVVAQDPPSTTHDFVMVDSPAFFVRNAADYAAFSRAMLAAAGQAQRVPLLTPSLRHALMFGILLGHFRRHRDQFAALRRVRRAPRSPLATTFYSNTVYRLGERAVRYALRPVDATAQAAVPPRRSPDWLREAVTEQLAREAAAFEFLVQFQTDPAAQPVEDPTIAWDDESQPWVQRMSRYVHVATLHLPRQEVSRERNESFGEPLAFNPWNARPEHAPIGGINRVRRVVYQRLYQQRHELNRMPPDEPVSAARRDAGQADRSGPDDGFHATG